MSRTILIADDEQHILSTASAYFKEAGYTVLTASNGRDALFMFRHEQPDLVILDVMMPEMDGWEAARLIRRESNLPIIFLTARIDDADQVAGLEIGADEYVTKPFSPRVLVAKVRALLRRTYGDMAAEPAHYRVGTVEVNTETHIVTKDGARVELTPSEFELLLVLVKRPGRVFSRMDLLERTQGEAFAAYERTIDVHVKNLRAKLEDDPRNPTLIETVYGVGYRLRQSDGTA